MSSGGCLGPEMSVIDPSCAVVVDLDPKAPPFKPLFKSQKNSELKTSRKLNPENPEDCDTDVKTVVEKGAVECTRRP